MPPIREPSRQTAPHALCPLALEATIQRCQTPIASAAQPRRNATPPSGVIAPSHVTPDTASAYKLPENKTVPARNNQPAAVSHGDPSEENRPRTMPTASNASA